MKSILFFCITLITVIFVIKIIQKPDSPKRDLSSINIGGTTLQVELADTPEKITLGLGERDTLGSDGMLFVMPTRNVPTFWMKGMRFDLDFVWIDGTTVVDLTENVRAEPGVSPERLMYYSPKSQVTHVLELNAGEISRRKIKVGDKVSY